MERALYPSLIQWKKEEKMPLILRGARQVGKTYLVESFGEQAFSSVANVNFELQPELASCFQNLEPRFIIEKLELLLNQRILPENSLLFLDEIQQCPQAITSLRYFKEKMPDL